MKIMKHNFLLAMGLLAFATTTSTVALSDDSEDVPSDHQSNHEVYSDAEHIPIKIAVNDIGQEDDQSIEGSDEIDGSETVSLTIPDLSPDQKKNSFPI